jgi:peptidoglycan biosynthesis protein MviN/MurJ (putative lipid II flippase)
VISLLLQGGKFTAAEVEVAARLVLLGLGVLFANSAGGVVVNTLYAMRRTAAAVWVNLGGLVFYLVAAPLAAQAWAVDGLALTMSIYFLLTFLAYLAILYRRLEGISWRSEAAYLARLGACCLLALTGAWGISAGLPGLAQVGAGTLLGLAWRLAFQAALLGGLYLLFCLALRVSEVQSLLSRLGQILLRPAAPLTPGEPATKDPS